MDQHLHDRPAPEVLRSVVRVLTTSDAPDYDQPWQTQGVTSSTGSGAIIETERGLRVLTNGHVVENQVFVEVRRYGRDRKYEAEVEGVGHECDLALLRIPDESFFEGTVPIPIGALPQLSDRVTVLGYPIGGDRLSVTRGVVSRIAMSTYAQSQRWLLAGQIDAAINSGNSGGPVVRKGAIVGIAFQTLDEGQNIGYMIAAPVIRHFLQDLENGTFDGFPSLGVVTQRLESPAHRRQLKLGRRTHGVLVRKVVYGSSAWKTIRAGDVLLEVDGVKIGADGTVHYRRNALLHHEFVVSQRHVGENMKVTVFRDGRVRRISVTLKPPQYLVPEDQYDVRPSYYVYGGLLFVPLTRDYLKTWGEEWWANAPRSLMQLYETQVRSASRTQVVVLQKTLADTSNRGYHELGNIVVEKVQGRRVRDLAHVVRLIARARTEFIRIEGEDGRVVVLDRAKATQRLRPIMRRFGVPRDRSDDLPGRAVDA
jgi:S1-C subfamily serine protease